jgi:uracil-DNA glycosylase
VGLAPAAHGANRTGRVFTGDSSGQWLYEALHRSGFADRPVSLHREDGLTLTGAWITSAAHCAPPDNKPTSEELDRCRPFLSRELELLSELRVTLVLGRIAWEAWLRASGWWARLAPRERPAFAHGAEATLPNGHTLLCSFHPSRQNTNTGRLTRSMWHAVFDRARVLADAA